MCSWDENKPNTKTMKKWYILLEKKIRITNKKQQQVKKISTKYNSINRYIEFRNLEEISII